MGKLWGSFGEIAGGAPTKGLENAALRIFLRADRWGRSQEENFGQVAETKPKCSQPMRSQRTPCPEPSPLKRIASWR